MLVYGSKDLRLEKGLILYNELTHEKCIKPFFHGVQDKISIFFKQRWRGMKQHCVVTHTHMAIM